MQAFHRAQYLAALPRIAAPRSAPVRKAINENLPDGYEEEHASSG